MSKVPQHIAIIMDGNGRWAKQRGLPHIMGHRQGVAALKEAVKTCGELGVKYLTVYAFSTENWGRPEQEVNFLMNLFSEKIEKEIEELNQKNVRWRFLGRLQGLPKKLHERIQRAMDKLDKNTGLNFNIMVNYGGRAEIVDAIKSINNGQLDNEQINEAVITEHLYTRGIPDPDLLIRTANEMRISNFLLWQIAYSEIYVTPVLWPDFKKENLLEAIQEFNKRERRYGLRK